MNYAKDKDYSEYEKLRHLYLIDIETGHPITNRKTGEIAIVYNSRTKKIQTKRIRVDSKGKRYIKSKVYVGYYGKPHRFYLECFEVQ